MKRIIFIAFILLGIVAPTTYAQISKKKVAVYMTGEIEDSYKKVIGAKLVSAITATDEYAAVERTADFLAALASEQDYQTSGEVRNSQIASIGQRFGVLYVVVADVNKIFGEMFISARLINVETGLVDRSADETGNPTNMSSLIELSNRIANKLLKGFAVGSTSPAHMALCTSLKGKTIYFTEEQWKMVENKESYTKVGLCLIQNGQKIILVGHRWGESFNNLYRNPDLANKEWSYYIVNNFTYIKHLVNNVFFLYNQIKLSSFDLSAKDVVYKGIEIEGNKVKLINHYMAEKNPSKMYSSCAGYLIKEIN